ncbi:MAG: dihydroorotase [Rhodospirillaceae bacterium]|jgi:dihydroorotase|nr:dihydroorotase [Rhodospirillaceae bacterium]MBT6119565.1 dihydroorotase [Rhodospirillaceae bacterium]
MAAAKRIEIVRPDDWHLHLRDGAMLEAVLPYTAALYGRAIIMPNLAPPVRMTAEAEAYEGRIRAALPEDHPFRPLMTLYLTDTTDAADLRAGFESGAVTAVKLYPAGATTNSESGVTDTAKVASVLDAMAEIGMPLLVHGEVTDPDVDVFDREAVFIDTVLDPMRRRHPDLRVVLEHATTARAVDYVLAEKQGIAASITPHHLVINRNALFAGGLRPHMYCLPIAKREENRQALRRAATSGDGRFFLGTDSAPHPARLKETDCGCAGIFNAPNALEYTARVFEEEGALDRLEAFCSLNGPAFYRLLPNDDRIVLEKGETPESLPDSIAVPGGDSVRVFRADPVPLWRLSAGRRPVGRTA